MKDGGARAVTGAGVESKVLSPASSESSGEPVKRQVGLPPLAPLAEEEVELTGWQRWWAWWRSWKGILLALAFAGVIFGVWRGRELYLSTKHWRAEYLLSKAEVMLSAGDDVTARNLLREAIALVQAEPNTFRAVAQYYARHDDRAAVAYYERLDKTGAATTEDRIAGAREAFRFGMGEQGSSFLKSLMTTPETAVLPSVIALQAEQHAWDGRWPEALTLARAAVSRLRPGEGADERLVLARILLRPPLFRQNDRPRLQREALGILDELASRPDAGGVHALQFLETLTQDAEFAPLLVGAKVQPWMDAAARNPGATPALRVHCWDLRIAAAPDQRAAIVQELAGLAGQVSLADQLEISRWLNQQGAFALASRLAEPSRLKSEEWFMVYLDAIAGQGDWEEVLNEVKGDTPVPLPVSVRRIFQLRAELVLHRDPSIGFSWNAIELGLASAKPGQRLYVAGYAEQMGFPQRAAPIYQRLLSDGVFPVDSRRNSPRLACYLGVIRTAAAGMTTPELAKLFADLGKDYPDMEEAQNDGAYLQLLLGEDLAPASETAQRLLRKRPELLSYRTTAALAALRTQQPEAALALYEGVNVQWETAPERFKAVRVAVLAANGREAEAASLRETLNRDLLRPEERKLGGLPN